MERRVGKLNRWIAALFLCLAAGLCALAGTLFVRAETAEQHPDAVKDYSPAWRPGTGRAPPR